MEDHLDKRTDSSGFPVYGANGQIGFYSEYNHEHPTILITCRGATCGRINISGPRSYVNGNAMALDDLDEMHPRPIGSGDQGIDAFGWQGRAYRRALFFHQRLWIARTSRQWIGKKVYFLASSKANIGQGAEPDPINPAFIRELIGGWLLQRTATGKWSQLGILPLSPVQLVLVTTYRISPSARGECMSLGVQVWALPELIFFVAKYAPDDVFAGNAFVIDAFNAWWQTKDESRVNYEELAAVALGSEVAETG